MRPVRHELPGSATSTVRADAAMTISRRVLAIVVAVVLLGYPPFLIYGITVPVPRFRTGSSADFTAFAYTMLAVYGGVLVGVAVHWARVGRARQHMRPFGVLKAGAALFGAIVSGGAALLLLGVRRI